MEDSVVLWPCTGPPQAAQAMDALQHLHEDGTVAIRAMAVVARDADGRLHTVGDVENVEAEGTVAGGLVGALLGALAGPAGVVLGGAAGVLAGSSADARQPKEQGRIVGAVARRIAPGAVAVVADVMESRPEVIDALAASAGARVTRWSRHAVVAELADTGGRAPLKEA